MYYENVPPFSLMLSNTVWFSFIEETKFQSSISEILLSVIREVNYVH